MKTKIGLLITSRDINLLNRLKHKDSFNQQAIQSIVNFILENHRHNEDTLFEHPFKFDRLFGIVVLTLNLMLPINVDRLSNNTRRSSLK